MIKLKYLDSIERYPVEFSTVSKHVIQAIGSQPEKTCGFNLYDNNNQKLGEYPGFTTIYRSLEEGYQYSDDGSIYVPPVPPEPPTPVEPTLEETQEKKINEMSQEQQSIISAGVTVTLSIGEESFSLKDKDQSDIDSLALQIAGGVEYLPWHENDENKHCKFYSAADMKLLIEAAQKLVTYQVTYYRDLRIYIRSLTTIEEVNEIEYGTEIPEEYQSEVLKALLK